MYSLWIHVVSLSTLHFRSSFLCLKENRGRRKTTLRWLHPYKNKWHSQSSEKSERWHGNTIVKAPAGWLSIIWHNPLPKKYSNKCLPKLYCWLKWFQRSPPPQHTKIINVGFFSPHVKRRRSNKLGMCKKKERINVYIWLHAGMFDKG